MVVGLTLTIFFLRKGGFKMLGFISFVVLNVMAVVLLLVLIALIGEDK